MERPTYLQYWGKFRCADDICLPLCHLLPYHCLDVAAVGKVFLEQHHPLRRTLSKMTSLAETDLIDWFVFLLALHDVGKFAVTFQHLRPELLRDMQNRVSNKPYTVKHDSLGYAFWRHFLKRYFQNTGLLESSRRRAGIQAVDYWVMAVTGHHGVPPRQNFPGFLLGDHFESQDKDAVEAFSKDLVDVVLGGPRVFPGNLIQNGKTASWWLAGFAVLCDWLGSNREFFPYQNSHVRLEDYWELTLGRAKQAIESTELLPAHPSTGISLAHLLPDTASITPTDLQRLTAEIPLIAGPQLFILEEVTGAGKTEAAILLAHRLMKSGSASGIYFGLPTMATANAMYTRLGGVYHHLYEGQPNPSIVLAHSARDLSNTFRQSLIPVGKTIESDYDVTDAPPASVHCSRWLADNRKKALLAEIGIGTIDQALLGILPSRHQSLRLLGLMNKVLLVDEVHACDAYMQPLLCNLLRAHAIAGGSAILLSATLPHSQRQELVNAFTHGLEQPPSILDTQAYPLLTHCSGSDVIEYQLETRPSVRRHVRVGFVDSTQAVERLLTDSFASGQCACWIRNTVADAREAYRHLKGQHPDWNIDLFHARFALADRLAIEQRVLERFGKASNSHQRNSQILIATQVVEQSLDLDFDQLITDLAPIDLIIQRAGRLHRHLRDARGNRIAEKDKRADPTLTVHAPTWSDNPSADWFKRAFPRVRTVYEDHGQLWLTMKLLLEKGGFRMPEDARELIEGVYGEKHEISEDLWRATVEAQGTNKAKASLAFVNQLNLESGYSTLDATNWWDEAKTPTRLGEETTTVWLARWEKGELKPLHDQPPFAWQQSSVAMRTALIAETASRPEIPDAVVEACHEQLPAKGKWGVLLPLIEDTPALWKGNAKDLNSNPAPFYYDSTLGLINEKEYKRMEKCIL